MARSRTKVYKLENSEFWMDKGIDLENRVLMLYEEIDETTVGYIIRGIHILERQNPDLPVTLIINTIGGSVYDGLALYDVLRASPCQIITIGIGKVMSMGCDLLLAGDVKKAYPNTTFMWHTMSSETVGKLFELEGGMKEAQRVYDQTLEIYGERSKKPKSFWQKWLKHEDRYGDIDKAIELGFVEEVIPLRRKK